IGPKWMFDIDTLTMSMNYQPVVAGNQSIDNAGIKENLNADDDFIDVVFDVKENENDTHVSANGRDKTDNKKYDEKAKRDDKGKSHVDSLIGVRDLRAEFEEFSFNISNRVNDVNAPFNAIGPNPTNNTNNFNTASLSVNVVSSIFGITRKSSFMDPSKYPDDPDMPELKDIVYSDDEEDVDLPKGKRAIGSKWVFRNKKDERGIVIRNKARHVAQGHTQEEGIDYDEVFAPVARIEAIRLFLAYASFMGFMVYQMDVKSAFLYGTIEEEVYVCQPLGFEDFDYPDKVYKVTLFIKKQKGDILLVQVYVDDIIIGSTNKELCKAFEKLMKDNQDKYVVEILRKFGFIYVKSVSTLIETEKPLLKDPDGEDVDVHIYMLMIRSLMYLTSSRLDIMFVICACVRFQVTPKVSHLHAVKRIFRYLKGKPHLGLWYPRDSSLNLMVYSDSDYAGASLDRKSTTRGCQFLGCGLIYWQCKKQTVVATSSTKAEYVAAANCCAQVLWIQNQLLNYGMVSNVVSLSKFLMYPRFLQVILDHQVDDMTTHNTRYTSLALTQKVFVILRRVGNGFSGEKIADIDADEGIILVDEELDEKEVAIDADAVEPIVFDDEDIIMTMAQTLIKLKAEKAKILDEKIAQKLHDEEVQKATARDKQERADMERALDLQRQYDEKEENIDWSVVVEQV
nr:hypothetical protein [Tanacetum cinerariifolium]